MAKIRKIYDDAIKPDGSKQVIYPVTSTRAVYTTTNVTVDAILNEGYRFGGVVLPTDTPSILDQRSFYAASVPGVYTSFGNIAVNSGEAIFLMWDGVNWKKGIFASASFSTLTGFKALASISDLPLEETRFGYLINEHLYVWVGENGDTLDGKYLDCGELRGASAYEVAVRNGYTGSEQEWLQDPINGIKGISVQSVECIHEALEDGGTNIWRITLTNGQSTDFEVKNGNQGNSGYQGAAEELEVVNNLTDGGATAALSAEMGKAIVDLYGTYIENPEFVRVILDKEDRILMAIRNDGDIYFGVGCPSQVKDYVEEKLHEFSPEGYAEIVAFLEGELHSGKTLAQLLSEQDAEIIAEKERAELAEASKVDKEEGKSLISEDFADTISTIDSPEFIEVKVDSEDKILEGIKLDGTKVVGGDLQVGGDIINSGIQRQIDEATEEMKQEVQETIEELTSQLDVETLSSFSTNENPEYIEVKTDSEDHILEGIKSDGTKVIGADLNVGGNSVLNGNLQVLGSLDISGATYSLCQSPEWIKVLVDSQERIIAGVRTDGSVYINKIEGLEAQVEEIVNNYLIARNNVDISLPDKLYAVVGDTLQLFFRGIIKAVNPYNYDILVTCTKGQKFPRYFEYIPQAADIGTTTFKITLKDDNREIISEKTCQLITVAKGSSPSSNKNIAIFGDSLTAGGVWPVELNRRLKGSGGTPSGDGKTNITFCGKNNVEGVGFFGRGGFAWSHFTSAYIPAYRLVVSGVTTGISINAHYTDGVNDFYVMEVNVTEGSGTVLMFGYNAPQATSGTMTKTSGSGANSIAYSSYTEEGQNPLWDYTNNKMSFVPYVNEYCNGQLDVVVTFLSWNSVSTGQTDFSTIMSLVKMFADTLHTEYPNAKMKLMGIQVCSVNGGMGADYGATGTSYADQYGMVVSALNLNKAYQDFANEPDYSSFVEFVNVSAEFDSEYNMQSAAKVVNTRNNQTEVIGTNGVHPANDGYLQIADVMYRNLVSNYCQ